jgi:hypothetical protein
MSKYRRFVGAAVAAISLTAAMAGSATAASTVSPSVDEDQIAHMTDFWTVNGVDEAVQDDLLAGIERGVWPLADSGEAEPVSTVDVERNGNVETVQTYADGSIAVSAVQVTEGAFDPSSFAVDSEAELAELAGGVLAPRAITGCKVASGSGYSNYTDCRVFGSTATVGAGFIASYTIVQGNLNDRILRHSGPFQQCGGAVCDVPYAAIEYLTEQSGRHAQVAYFFRWTVANGASATGSITLDVGGNSATSVFHAKA